jgi:hypothetical protein
MRVTSKWSTMPLMLFFGTTHAHLLDKLVAKNTPDCFAVVIPQLLELGRCAIHEGHMVDRESVFGQTFYRLCAQIPPTSVGVTHILQWLDTYARAYRLPMDFWRTTYLASTFEAARAWIDASIFQPLALATPELAPAPASLVQLPPPAYEP